MRERGSTRRSGVLARRSTDLALDVILNSSTSGEISRTLDDRCLPVAVCCSVLQCVAVCCSVLRDQPHVGRSLFACVLQCVAVCLYNVAVCCSVLRDQPHVGRSLFACCSVLQCVAVCCSVSQCVADQPHVRRSLFACVLQCVAECCSVSQCVAVCRSVLQSVAESCSVSQCIAECCSVSQCVAVCCSVLQCVSSLAIECIFARMLRRWLWLVGSIKLQVSFVKEPYKRDNNLQKRPIISSILLTIATPQSYYA